MSQGRSRWEPRRWSDGASDAPPVLRAALQDARVTTVTGARVAKLAERLGIGGAFGASAGTGLASTLPPNAAVAYKLWAYLSGVVMVSGVALTLGAQLVAGPSPDASIDSAQIALLREPPAAPLASNRVDVLAPSAGTLGLAAVTDVPSAAAAMEAAPSKPTLRVPRRRSGSAASLNPVSVAAKLDPEAELTILNSAQDALRQAPRRALSLAEDHARSFPRGVFAQEREVIAIEALMKLQRSGDATDRGRAFLAAFPTSTHASRVQQMLAD